MLFFIGIFIILLGVGGAAGEISFYTALQWAGFDAVALFVLWIFMAPIELLIYIQFAFDCMLLVTILGKDPEVPRFFH